MNEMSPCRASNQSLIQSFLFLYIASVHSELNNQFAPFTGNSNPHTVNKSFTVMLKMIKVRILYETDPYRNQLDSRCFSFPDSLKKYYVS